MYFRMNPESVIQRVWANRLQTALLIGVLSLFMAIAGYLLGGRDMALAAVLGALISAALAPWASPTLVLRHFRARPLYPQEAPELHALVARLAERAGLERPPALYLMPATVLNAFAVGEGRHAAICLSAGLLQALDREQLAGVLAHEMAHLRNRDTRLMGLADLTSRMTHFLTGAALLLIVINLPFFLWGDAWLPWPVLLFLMFGPTVVDLLQLALSRTREYQADAVAAVLLGTPVPLIRALAALERGQGVWERLFMAKRRLNEPSVLRTHPPTEERIARLQEMLEVADRLS
ncbi:MAG: peptidase M48 [Gammaproteobacteria bacterium]|nr:MAG: peptidase M48 [Gammaproteobacteria bacterium]